MRDSSMQLYSRNDGIYNEKDPAAWDEFLKVVVVAIADATGLYNSDAVDLSVSTTKASYPISCFYKRTSNPVASSESEITYNRQMWWYTNWWRNTDNPDGNCKNECNTGQYIRDYYSGTWKTFVEGKANWSYCLCEDHKFH